MAKLFPTQLTLRIFFVDGLESTIFVSRILTIQSPPPLNSSVSLISQNTNLSPLASTLPASYLAMQLYLIRHAETVHNVGKVL